MSVDWSKPIEALHEDGRVVAVEVAENDGSDMPWRIAPDLPDRVGYARWFYSDGTRDGTSWRIRNVPSDTPNPYGEARTEAKGVSGYVNDTQGLQARCERLVRRIAAGDWAPGYSVDTETEARAIVRELDKRLIITDLMAKDMPERDKLVAAFEAGRADRFELENGA